MKVIKELESLFHLSLLFAVLIALVLVKTMCMIGVVTTLVIAVNSVVFALCCCFMWATWMVKRTTRPATEQPPK